MDVAKASERLLKLAVSMYIYVCIHVQIYKRVPGVSEIDCKSTITKFCREINPWGYLQKYQIIVFINLNIERVLLFVNV